MLLFDTAAGSAADAAVAFVLLLWLVSAATEMVLVKDQAVRPEWVTAPAEPWQTMVLLKFMLSQHNTFISTLHSEHLFCRLI